MFKHQVATVPEPYFKDDDEDFNYSLLWVLFGHSKGSYSVSSWIDLSVEWSKNPGCFFLFAQFKTLIKNLFEIVLSWSKAHFKEQLNRIFST